MTSFIKSETLAVTSFPFLLVRNTATAAPEIVPKRIDENLPIISLLSYFLNSFVIMRKADKVAPALTLFFPAAAAFLLK